MDRTRKKSGSRAVDVSELHHLIKQLGPSPSLTYGVVYKPTGESSHAEIGDDDVLVHVQLMPDETPVLARLFTAAAGSAAGVWKVPKPGTEVLIALPGDEVEAGPVIVACSPTGSVPSNLDDNVMTIDNPDGDILVQGGTQKVARVDDTTGNGTLEIIGGISSSFGGLKYTAPDGTVTTITATGAPITIKGKINSGADHFKA